MDISMQDKYNCGENNYIERDHPFISKDGGGAMFSFSVEDFPLRHTVGNFFFQP